MIKKSLVQQLVDKWENDKDGIIKRAIYDAPDYKHFKKLMERLGKT